jgi:hypothetical protein
MTWYQIVIAKQHAPTRSANRSPVKLFNGAQNGIDRIREAALDYEPHEDCS